MGKLKAGIIGTGVISDVYLRHGSRFESMEIVACADLHTERAEAKAAQYGIRGCSVSELLADRDIGLVINLTVPQAHAEIGMQALKSGKHVYSEKPLSVTCDEARQLLDYADMQGLRVGCAPDTFLGGGLQTCMKLINDGWIGKPIGATAFMLGSGPESSHPDPAFFYQQGGGPMFDMGPYYLTALIALLGPLTRVTGSAGISFPERTITSKPKYGQKISVEVPTHVAGVIDFASGAIGTVITSFDVRGGTTLPRIEIYGSEGTIVAPDPNKFAGPVRLCQAGSQEWTTFPLTHGYADHARGIGAADLAKATFSGRKHRADGRMAYHVLEAMHGFHQASETGVHYRMESTCEQPKPLPAGLLEGQIDD